MKNQHGLHVLPEIEDGFFLVARKIVHSSLNSTRPEDFKLAINLIALANWTDQKWYDGYKKEEIFIRRGQYITSIRKLSGIVHMSEQIIRTSLARLNKSSFLTQESTQGYTKITLCNYDRYQFVGNYANTDSNECLTNDQRIPNKYLTNAQQQYNKGNKGNKDKHVNKGSTGTQSPDEPKKKKESELFLISPLQKISTCPKSTHISPLATLWNETVGKRFPRAMFESGWRRKKARERLAGHPDLDWWRDVFKRMLKSSFLLGEQENKKWRPDFDWIIRNEENAFRVLEGRYDDPIDPNTPPPPRDITNEPNDPEPDISDEEHRAVMDKLLNPPNRRTPEQIEAEMVETARLLERKEGEPVPF